MMPQIVELSGQLILNIHILLVCYYRLWVFYVKGASQCIVYDYMAYMDLGVQQSQVTRCCWVTHVCVSKLIIIGSDNALSPGWCHAIIWTNPGIFLNGPLGTNFREILIEIHAFENVIWLLMFWC